MRSFWCKSIIQQSLAENCMQQQTIIYSKCAPEQHIHDALLTIAGQPYHIAGIEIVAIAPVVGKIGISFLVDQLYFHGEQLSVCHHAPAGSSIRRSHGPSMPPTNQ